MTPLVSSSRLFCAVTGMPHRGAPVSRIVLGAGRFTPLVWKDKRHVCVDFAAPLGISLQSRNHPCRDDDHDDKMRDDDSDQEGYARNENPSDRRRFPL